MLKQDSGLQRRTACWLFTFGWMDVRRGGKKHVEAGVGMYMAIIQVDQVERLGAEQQRQWR
jgi:hypothetical protein